MGQIGFNKVNDERPLKQIQGKNAQQIRITFNIEDPNCTHSGGVFSTGAMGALAPEISGQSITVTAL